MREEEETFDYLIIDEAGQRVGTLAQSASAR